MSDPYSERWPTAEQVEAEVYGVRRRVPRVARAPERIEHKAPRPLPRQIPAKPAPELAPRCVCVTEGLRAPRYALSLADVEAHPDLFRCPDCNRLLDGPA